MKMDAEIKAKWTEALRSGKYPQAKRFLHSQGGYCCLGVLCDIVAPDGWEPEMETGTMGSYFPFGGDCASAYPPDSLEKKVGITRDTCKMLALMNDDKDCTFAEIADWVEENL